MSRLTDNGSYCLIHCADDYKGMEALEENCELYEMCYERKMYDKLKYYEDLEEQGSSISLPCKVGDKVWIVVEEDDGYSLQMDIVEGVHIHQYGGYSLSCRFPSCIDTTTLQHIPLTAFGNVIFTNKAEAEAKLAEMGCGCDD